MRCAIWSALIAGIVSACAAKAPATFVVAVRVESDPGQGLAGATLALRGQTLAVSDARGLSLATLAGAPGETSELTVSCPSGHRSPAAPLTVKLRPAQRVEDRPEYQVSCPRLERKLVVAVKVDGASNLPVRVLGEELARTDRYGAAHALLNVAPGEVVVVTLDTSAQPRLLPHDPELRVVMPEHDQVVLFEQTFSEPRPRRKPRPKLATGPTPI